MRTRLQQLAAQAWSVGIAIVLTVFVILEVVLSDRGGRGVVAVLVAIAALGVARWYPLQAAFAALGIFLLGAIVAPASLYHVSTGGAVAVIACCIFGSLREQRDRLIGLAGTLCVLFVLVLRAPDAEFRAGGESRAGALSANVVLFIVGWGVTWAVASRVRATRELRAQTVRLGAERDAAATEAVAEERARIARELHDVVAHSVSVMTVQAGGVRRLLTEDQTRERDALAAIEETGRKALAEMRRMVGVMRSDGESAALEPQPGIGTLSRLVEEVREAGLPVTLNLTGVETVLPPGVDLSVYRIVQEGLTNVLKHAGPAHAWVNVQVGRDDVDLLVEDDGTGTNRANGGGHGLIGMRERVTVYGGDLETGPREGGGFRIHARLPVDRTDTPSAS